MAETAVSTSTNARQVMLTVADVNTAVNHEARIEDVKLAASLGMAQPREIRRLIERHREALERFGAICVTVTQNTDPKGRGRPGKTCWLTKRQALYICTKSETPNATDATIQMVEVFDAYLEAHAAQGQHPTPALDRNGFALMRIGKQTVLVDTKRFSNLRQGERAVVFRHDGRVAIMPVQEDRTPNWYGARAAMTRPHKVPKGHPYGSATVRDSVQVVGVVVEPQSIQRH